MISYSIYIIDDEETVRDGITLSLGVDYRVEAFSKAEAAIASIKKKPPDLILLDMYPKMTHLFRWIGISDVSQIWRE